MTPVTSILAAGIGTWAIGGIVLCVVILCAMHIAAGRSKARARWAPVLDAETKRWSAKSCAELIQELNDVQAYEVEFESGRYQVEVELLENTPQYVHVAVGVDDGSLPASFRPLATTFLRYKDTSD